jgi:hypothetical protein
MVGDDALNTMHIPRLWQKCEMLRNLGRIRGPDRVIEVCSLDTLKLISALQFNHYFISDA